MYNVTQQDAAFLHAIQRVFMGREVNPSALGFENLSEGGAACITDTIKRGLARVLLTNGALPEEGLDDTAGRIWDRYPHGDLKFSSYATEIFRFNGRSRHGDSLHVTPQTPGDSLLGVLVASAGNRRVDMLTRYRLENDPLAGLMFPDSGISIEPEQWIPWMSGSGAIILAALGPRITDSIVAAQQRVYDSAWPITAIAGANTRHSYLTACQVTEREDLARLIVRAIVKAYDVHRGNVYEFVPTEGAATMAEIHDVHVAAMDLFATSRVMTHWRTLALQLHRTSKRRRIILRMIAELDPYFAGIDAMIVENTPEFS
jgi:hypothetical protein